MPPSFAMSPLHLLIIRSDRRSIVSAAIVLKRLISCDMNNQSKKKIPQNSRKRMRVEYAWEWSLWNVWCNWCSSLAVPLSDENPYFSIVPTRVTECLARNAQQCPVFSQPLTASTPRRVRYLNLCHYINMGFTRRTHLAPGLHKEWAVPSPNTPATTAAQPQSTVQCHLHTNTV